MTADGSPRVLIVEDEALVRETACDEFVEAGFEVVVAADGYVAVEALNANVNFDLLFTDIRMPGAIDGWSVAAIARSKRPDIAVIYATGFSENQGRIVENSKYFKKPYRMAAILQAARELGVLPPAPAR